MSDFNLNKALRVLIATGTTKRIPLFPYFLKMDYGIEVSLGSIRNELSAMVSRGELVKWGRGRYALPGQVPKPVDLESWVRYQLVTAWPGAHNLPSLLQNYQVEMGMEVPEAHVLAQLTTLTMRGFLVTSTARGRKFWTWHREPTAEDMPPAPTVNPFA